MFIALTIVHNYHTFNPLSFANTHPNRQSLEPSYHLPKQHPSQLANMAEPIPSASNDTEDTKPTNAEDRKAAAALDSLNANDMSQENGEDSGSKQPTAADQEALGKAMARLEGVVGGKGGAKNAKVEGKGNGDVKGVVGKKKEKEEETKKKVKVDAGDVQFLVSCVVFFLFDDDGSAVGMVCGSRIEESWRKSWNTDERENHATGRLLHQSVQMSCRLQTEGKMTGEQLVMVKLSDDGSTT